MSSSNGGNQALAPFQIAAGLLRNDRRLFIPLLMFLASPGLYGLFSSLDVVAFQEGLFALDRIVQLLVVSFIALRWRERLQNAQGPKVARLAAVSRVILIGCLVWILLWFPIFGLLSSGGLPLGLLFGVLGILGAMYALRVYFYFAVTTVLGLSIVPTLIRSVRMGTRSRSAVVQSMVTPVAVVFLATSLCFLPFPDGRSLLWSSLAHVSEGIFLLLSTYIALAFALVLFDDKEWRVAGLDRYRLDRLLTIQKQGSAELSEWLTPRKGFIVLGCALVVHAFNMYRQLHEPPAAQVSIERVWLSDYSIKVELEISDSVYHFRGFVPQALSVASKTGFGQSTQVVSVSKTMDGPHLARSLADDRADTHRIFVTFRSNKNAAALKTLDNMWLWYYRTPLIPIPQERMAEDTSPSGGG